MTHGPPKLSLAGHEGHLTSEQENALEELKRILVDAGLYSPAKTISRPDGSGAVVRPASHSDTVLLRYLRARSFSPPKALKQFSDSEHWLKEMDIENLYARFPVDEFVASQKFYPMWCGRRDRTGYPIHVYKLSALDNKAMKELEAVPVDRRYQQISVLYQLLMVGTLPLCASIPSTDAPETPPDGTCTLVDLEGVSIGLMWSLRTHLQQASVLANANFPETMGMTFIVNAPGFFSTVWGWLKVWFDEHTRNKIHFLSKSSQHLLFEQIAKESVPKAYGGTLDWEFGDQPNLEDGIKNLLGDAGGSFPEGPWALIDGKVCRGEAILSEKQRLYGQHDEITQKTVIDNVQ